MKQFELDLSLRKLHNQRNNQINSPRSDILRNLQQKQASKSPKIPKQVLTQTQVTAAIDRYLKSKQNSTKVPIVKSVTQKQIVTQVSQSRLELNLMQSKITPLAPQTHRSSSSQDQKLQFLRKKQLTNKAKSLSQQMPSFFTSQSKPYYLHKMKLSFQSPITQEYFHRLYRDHFIQTYEGINMLDFLQPIDTDLIRKRMVRLPKKEQYNNKITLILDLDETLVHCNESHLMPSDVILNIKVGPFEVIQAGINIRPGVQSFLESISKDFEVIIFTASHQSYAEKVIDYLDPQKKWVSHALYRDSCILNEMGMFIKDLRIFDRSLNQMLLVDNASYSYMRQLDNGIPIIPYFDNKGDRELESLKQYLQNLLMVSDVRKYNRENLKLYYFQDQMGPMSVYEKLFNQKMES